MQARNAAGLSPMSNTLTATPKPTAEPKKAPRSAERGSDGACPGDGAAPTPVEVAVTVVPIVVASTTDDYFVLYVRHDLDGAEVEIPVLVKRGEAGTTTLAENVAALPAERYQVEKYQVADPADIDGDCIDDIAELADPVGRNPVNPAAAIDISHGALRILNHETFKTLATLATNDPEGPSVVKFIMTGTDTDRPTVAFANTNMFGGHDEFLDARGVNWQDALTGVLMYDPRAIAPNGNAGVYRYSIDLPIRVFSSQTASLYYTVLAAGIPALEDNLAMWLRNSWLPHIQPELSLLRESRVNLVFDEDIIGELDFLALNPGEGYGLLRVLEPDERPNPRDIALYETLPNELPRVAGVISTAYQTPLSHVNLRAIQDGIPNAYIRDALDDEDIAALLGRHVHYTVTESGYTLREVTRMEVDAHYASSRPAQPQTPQRDLSVTAITPLSEIGFADWPAFGVKAANVAVLGTLGFPPGAIPAGGTVPMGGTVPDGFAVPFYFYDEFMKANDLYTDIREMLADTDFQTDFDEQADQLKKLRKKIKKGATPAWIITALEAMHAEFPEGTSLRYRSSTNNEDLPGFSGAGLYDSKTQKPDETEEDGIDKSLKQVFASLWNFRAYVERDFHRIDHLATAMGVLVHPNYSDELANGVAVSFDPVRGRDGAYYVNTQLGEDLVTNPEAYSVPEEILLFGGAAYTVLATSNQVEPGQLLLTGVQMDQLHRHLTAIHDHFKQLYRPAAGDPFAMEIEFKITSDDILAIKQARPWVFGATNRPPAFPSTEAGRRTVAENTPAGQAIGAPVAATDPENDTLTYFLGDVDARFFTIVENTGQLSTLESLDYEVAMDSNGDNVYEVAVTARDSGGKEATIDVTINVTDLCEPTGVPGAPPAPRVSAASSGSLQVTWSAPASGICITGYDLHYRRSGSNSWSSVKSAGTSRNDTISGFSSGATYEVQVRAKNSRGIGGWSRSGSGTTRAATHLHRRRRRRRRWKRWWWQRWRWKRWWRRRRWWWGLRRRRWDRFCCRFRGARAPAAGRRLAADPRLHRVHRRGESPGAAAATLEPRITAHELQRVWQRLLAVGRPRVRLFRRSRQPAVTDGKRGRVGPVTGQSPGPVAHRWDRVQEPAAARERLSHHSPGGLRRQPGPRIRHGQQPVHRFGRGPGGREGLLQGTH